LIGGKYSRSQGLNYVHLDRKYSESDSRVQKRKELSDEITEDEEEEDEETDEIRSEKDAAMQKVNARRDKDESEREDEQESVQIAKCAVCHVIIDDVNLRTDAEQDPRSSEGYLLCQRCVRKLSVRSGR